jgi:pilus assembly protein CpaD
MTTQKLPAESTRRMRAALIVAGLSISLGGCLTHARDENGVLANTPADYRQRHPIVITDANQSAEVFVGSGRGGLSPAQRDDIVGLGQTWLREGTGGIVIEIPKGTPNERAAADSQREIRSLLISTGVPANGIATRDYHPRDPRQFATIRVSYPRITAQAGPCGLWPEDLGPSIKNRTYIENKPYHNFGCATQRNLAAMVDNPSDLVQPRAETPPYTARRSIAFDKYRKGNPTSTNYSSDSKAQLSDVGK